MIYMIIRPTQISAILVTGVCKEGNATDRRVSRVDHWDEPHEWVNMTGVSQR